MAITTGKSVYLAKALADHVYGKTTYTGPTTMYLALFSVTPSDGAGGTEATGSGYARVSITNNTTNWTNATGSTTPAAKTNGVAFAFPAATGNWSSSSNQVAWGLFDASSGGNLLHYGPIGTPAPVLNGQTFTFPIASLVISLQ